MIRSLNENDRPIVEKFIAGEPTHGSNTFDWYLPPPVPEGEVQPKGASVVVEDEEGPILVTKFTPILRFDTDFSPEASPQRIAKAITDGLAEMEKQAKSRGFSELVFESNSPKLIAFCKSLGYKESSDYRKVL